MGTIMYMVSSFNLILVTTFYRLHDTLMDGDHVRAHMDLENLIEISEKQVNFLTDYQLFCARCSPMYVRPTRSGPSSSRFQRPSPPSISNR